ncbi:MAG: DUF3604 domain-containing protein [Steroidobacteraceae bacterium]|jgi:hypothetical protein
MNRCIAIAGLWIAALPAALAADGTGCGGSQPGVKRAFFGDLHVHTSYSIDAYAVGTRVDPADAYAFAKGQELMLSDRHTRTRLERPLDFAAVTDHAEYFDVSFLCGDPNYSSRDWCRRFREASQPDPQIQGFRKFAFPLFAGPTSQPAPLCEAPGECRQARQSQWTRVRNMANEANEPCRFTAFVANEWSATPNAKHWHRNLIYSTDRVPDYPINVIDQPDLQAMWTALDQQCRAEDGCDVVAIPHNMNLAEGGGFDVESESELSLRLRARFERLAEVYQHKGASECLSDWSRRGEDDCNFELMFPSRFGGPFGGKVDEPTWNRMRSTYYRSLLARGLQLQQRLRFNPLQLGAVASTDTHNGTPGAVAEDAWLGHFGSDLNPSARFSLFPDASPGGLVGIWAEENTRASLFAALKRREVFGTSGPRIVVRFHALPAGAADPCQRGDTPSDAIPMGGTLPAGRRYRPMFVVQALMDREPLEKVQIVTGVLGPKGIEERVVDLVPSNGGAGTTLCAVHREPGYDPSRPAYWYARVLERPTKRWSKHDCESAGRCSPSQDRMIRERAWSSPIWRLP